LLERAVEPGADTVVPERFPEFFVATWVGAGRCVSAKGDAGAGLGGAVAPLAVGGATVAPPELTTLEPWVIPRRYSPKAVAKANMLG
jgi:hypothetical protein